MTATISTTSTRLRRLHTALLCDVLDGMGVGAGFVGPGVRPLAPADVVAGPAFTLRSVGVDAPPEQPYVRLLAAFQHMSQHEVLVIECGDRRSALWGELLSTAARVRGVTGVVLDGFTRDVAQTTEMGFPVFAAGISPLDSAGRQEIAEFGGRVRCGDADVSPGDWIFGDDMGVIVIPEAHLEEALRRAEEKDAGEATARDELLRGDDIGSVFARHGIL